MALETLQRVARVTVWISFAALLLSFFLETMLWPGCQRSPNKVVWAVQSLPLLLTLPGVVRAGPKAHIWLCFLLLGYFLVAVNALLYCPTLLVAIEIGLIVVLFISAMLFARWQAKLYKKHAGVSANGE